VRISIFEEDERPFKASQESLFSKLSEFATAIQKDFFGGEQRMKNS